MLPWIFIVLVLLNAGLFLWGYQREKALEPPLTPIPEGRHEIRLLAEASKGPQGDAADFRGSAPRNATISGLAAEPPRAAEPPGSVPGAEDVPEASAADSSARGPGASRPGEEEASDPAAGEEGGADSRPEAPGAE